MSRRVSLLVLTLLVLTKAPARTEWSRGGNGEVPLDGSGTSWVVRATINGKYTGSFLIDTGASYCVLAPSVAERLAITPTGEHVVVQTANGTVSAPVVRVATIDVGKNRARDVLAVVHPAIGPPLAGVIGLSFLNNFSYGIDSKRRLLRLD